MVMTDEEKKLKKKEYAKKYYEKNRDKLNKYNREWRQKKRDEEWERRHNICNKTN